MYSLISPNSLELAWPFWARGQEKCELGRIMAAMRCPLTLSPLNLTLYGCFCNSEMCTNVCAIENKIFLLTISSRAELMDIRVVLRVGIIACGSCTPCELCILTVFWVQRELRRWNVLASLRPCQPHSRLAGKPLQCWQWMHFGLYPWKFSEDFKCSTIMEIVNTKTKQQKLLNTPWN